MKWVCTVCGYVHEAVLRLRPNVLYAMLALISSSSRKKARLNGPISML